MQGSRDEAVIAARNALTRSREASRRETVDRLQHQVHRELAEPPPLLACVYLFGSWADDTFDGFSDIDLLAITPDDQTASEAERRLMTIADDVLAISERQWQRNIDAGTPFWVQVAGQRSLLIDTRGEYHK